LQHAEKRHYQSAILAA